MERNNKLHKNIGILISVVVVIGVVSITIFSGQKSQSSSSNQDQQTALVENSNTTTQNYPTDIPESSGSIPPIDSTNTSQIPPTDTPKKSVSVYNDGTYSAVGSYMSPGGPDQISITLTLKNDIITGTSAISGAGDHTSARYQNMFISNYKQYVVGKNIANVYLTKVSGSSLTPKGFDQALAKIKTQAKV